MTNLATQTDVEAELGRALTSPEVARINALLGRASALVRAACDNQPFTHTVNSGDVLVARGNKIRLPKRPVVSVEGVTLILPSSLGEVTLAVWSWDKVATIYLTPWDYIVNLPAILEDIDLSMRVLSYRVAYTSGYTTVPEDVVRVVAGSVARALYAPTPGLQSETIGGYSYKLADGYVTGTPTLTPDDITILAKYGNGHAWSAPLES
jgi:hypothetical protein